MRELFVLKFKLLIGKNTFNNIIYKNLTIKFRNINQKKDLKSWNPGEVPKNITRNTASLKMVMDIRVRVLCS